MEYLIKKLKAQIQDYIDNGGSIYDERRKLPYYDTLRYLKKKLQETNPDATIEDAYALCGFTMDREYNRFTLLNEELAKAVDEEGFVDDVKSKREHSHTKNVLNMLAKEFECSPSDYLVLMTKYRYKKAIIQSDYVAQLQEELNEAYPNGDITGIRWKNPKLYEKLRHFTKYAPEEISINDTLEYFGVTGSRFKDTTLTQEECEQIKQEFVEKYDPTTIESVKDFNFSDYQNLNLVAIKENLPVYNLLVKLGYSIKAHSQVSQFSRTKVDANEREQQLLGVRRQIIGELIANGENLPQDDRSLYYFNKKVTKLVLEKLYNLTPID